MESDCQSDKIRSKTGFICTKNYICLLVGLALLVACEQKETTVTNPPAEKKESHTTAVNPPTQKKESNTTVINPSQNQSPSTTKEKTEINVNTSPSPH